jgi:DNA-binding transcriptional LysR family regulator
VRRDKLEEQLGAKLFERAKKGVQLTPIGKKILHDLTPIREEGIARLTQAIERPDPTVIRIGCQYHFGRKYLIPLLAEMGPKLPAWKIYFSNVFKLHSTVLEGLIDFAFFASTEYSKDIVYHQLKEEEFRVFGLTDKFAHIAKAKSMYDLRNEPWVDGRYKPGEIFTGPLAVVADDVETTKLAVLAGLGIGTYYMDDVYTPDELAKLTVAPFIPNANSPENPLFPAGQVPIMSLVHRKQLTKKLKSLVQLFLKEIKKRIS